MDTEVIGTNIYEVKLEEVNPDLILTIPHKAFKTNVTTVQAGHLLQKLVWRDAVIKLLKS